MFARLSAWATGIILGAWIGQWLSSPHHWPRALSATLAIVLLMAGAAVMDYREARRVRDQAVRRVLGGRG